MWPGMGSAWKSVLGDAARSGLAHLAVAAKGGFGRTAMGAVWGGAAGGLYGALSNNTSVLGGAMAGAGLGAMGARYGGAALRRASFGERGIGVRGLGMMGLGQGAAAGIRNQARTDFRMAQGLARRAGNRIANPSILANRGINRIRSLFA